MKNNENIFIKPYTIGRNKKTYPKVRSWIPKISKEIANLVKHDRKAGHQITFATVDAPTGSSKLMFMAAFAEFISPGKHQLIIIHQTNLKKQHQEDIPGLINQGWLTKQVRVVTYQKIRSVIANYLSDKELNEDDQRLLDFLNKVEVVYLDEIHTYSKDKDVKSLPGIIKYLSGNSLKIALGITATSKHLAAWYTLIQEQMGVSDLEAYHTRKFVYKKGDAAKDGVIIIPDIVAVHTSMKLDLQIGEFTQEPWELADKTCAELEAMAQTITSRNGIKDTDPKSLREQVKNNQVAAKRLREHLDKFIENRSKECVYILNQSQQQGQPALVFAPLQANADHFVKLYNKNKKKLKHNFECIAWHGTSDDFSEGKGDSKAIQKRLQDPSDSLKTVVLVGMWKEGTDISLLTQVHDLGYKPYNSDRTDQIKGRLRNGGKYFIYLDAVNVKELTNEHIEALQIAFGQTDDPNFLASLQAAASASEFEGEDEKEQTGEVENRTTYTDMVDFDTLLNNFDLPRGEPTIVGWVKKVHKGDPTFVSIPADLLMNPNKTNSNLTEELAIKYLHKVLNVA